MKGSFLWFVSLFLSEISVKDSSGNPFFYKKIVDSDQRGLKKDWSG